MWRVVGWDIEAGNCVMTQEAYGGSRVERNGYPLIAHLRELNGDANTREPEGWVLGGNSFYSADM